MKKFLLLISTILLSVGILFSQGVKETTPSYLNVYVDSKGNEISLDKQYKRVISLSPNVSETIASLGAANLLVGRTDYCTYPPEIQGVETVGDLVSPSIEKIISLAPDIVIVSTIGQNQTLEALSNANINVAYIDKSQTMEGTFALIEDIGLLLNREYEAKKIVNEMKEEIKRVVQRVSSLEKISTYYVAGFGQWGDFTSTGDTFIHEMIELAGGDNIAKDARNWTFSLEQLLVKDPEIIILSSTWGSTFEETKKAFISYEAYAPLRAVTHDNIFPIDSDILNRQGPRSARAVTLLSNIIHR